MPRAILRAALPEMFGEHERGRLPARREVLAREPVPKDAIILRQQAIGRVAHQRMAEAHLPLFRETALPPLLQDLALDQAQEPALEVLSDRSAPEHRADPAQP